MKQNRRILLSLAVVLSLYSYFSSTAYAGDLNKGKQHYQKHCARCHGIDGKPVLPNAANFQRKEGLRVSEKSLINRIKTGHRSCPAFRGRLKDQELLELVSYLRVFR